MFGPAEWIFEKVGPVPNLLPEPLRTLTAIVLMVCIFFANLFVVFGVGYAVFGLVVGAISHLFRPGYCETCGQELGRPHDQAACTAILRDRIQNNW